MLHSSAKLHFWNESQTLKVQMFTLNQEARQRGLPYSELWRATDTFLFQKWDQVKLFSSLHAGVGGKGFI